MKVIRITAAMAFGLMVGLTAAARADDAKVENPLYKAWAGHKVGTSVTYTAEMNQNGTKKTMTVTATLKEKTDDGVTIETAADGHDSSRTIPAKVSPDSITADGDDTDIDAMGKKITCKKYKLSAEADGETGDEKATIYFNADVIGGLVKMDVGPASIVITGSDDKKD